MTWWQFAPLSFELRPHLHLQYHCASTASSLHLSSELGAGQTEEAMTKSISFPPLLTEILALWGFFYLVTFPQEPGALTLHFLPLRNILPRAWWSHLCYPSLQSGYLLPICTPPECWDSVGTEKEFCGYLQKGCMSCRDTPRPMLHMCGDWVIFTEVTVGRRWEQDPHRLYFGTLESPHQTPLCYNLAASVFPSLSQGCETQERKEGREERRKEKRFLSN